MLQLLDLEEWRSATAEEVASAVRQIADRLALTIGIASAPLPGTLDPLLDALAVTLVNADADNGDKRVVAMDNPRDGFARISATVRRCPQASVAAGQLLRQTARLDTLRGLAAEAAVYSMLLGGGEFAAWLAQRGAVRRESSPEPQPVLTTRDDQRLAIRLNRPDRRNAFSFAMREALYEALEVAAVDDTITAVDVSGAGPVFCSGGDLAEFGTATDLVAAYFVRLNRAPWLLIDQLADRITIRIQGAAVGAGVEMAAFAGRLVAAEETFFRLPEVSMGLVPGAGGTVSIPRRVGRWRTAWLMLSGDRIDAATALNWGLVDALTKT